MGQSQGRRLDIMNFGLFLRKLLLRRQVANLGFYPGKAHAASPCLYALRQFLRFLEQVIRDAVHDSVGQQGFEVFPGHFQA